MQMNRKINECQDFYSFKVNWVLVRQESANSFGYERLLAQGKSFSPFAHFGLFFFYFGCSPSGKNSAEDYLPFIMASAGIEI